MIQPCRELGLAHDPDGSLNSSEPSVWLELVEIACDGGEEDQDSAHKEEDPNQDRDSVVEDAANSPDRGSEQ